MILSKSKRGNFMLGNLIGRIRIEKSISKTKLANETGINVGHLTHIEKGTRKPSHKALMSIANSLGVPFHPLYTAYDKELDEKQIELYYMNHVTYNSVPAISKIDGYIDCPANFSNASFAYKVSDNSMNPIIKENTYVFIEINGLVRHKDIGLFRINNEFVIRKLLYKKDYFILKANDKNYDDIKISKYDDFQIIGKVYI